jgi:hypothetical protein
MSDGPLLGPDAIRVLFDASPSTTAHAANRHLGRWHVSAVELDVAGLPLPAARETAA